VSRLWAPIINDSAVKIVNWAEALAGDLARVTPVIGWATYRPGQSWRF
jgi:hypothetical protein